MKRRGSNTSHDEVSQAHPELSGTKAERMSDAYRGVAQGYGTSVSTLAEESRRAEESSKAGNDVAP
ncbi:hypothetical protein ACFW2V_12540 [Streptomyces sp. NPDC058947]|uniref:hypothetical protein n=1 Tax=Streptomyces sp. NPDC058947 TaxID=3346675 RepID=UPI0036B600AA